jgi:hypothetical protein
MVSYLLITAKGAKCVKVGEATSVHAGHLVFSLVFFVPFVVKHGA